MEPSSWAEALEEPVLGAKWAGGVSNVSLS